MIAQRPARSAPVARAIAERLPFADTSFEVVLAVLTVHHWLDPAGGLAELRRVAPRQVVVTFDREATNAFWLVRDYLPELRERVWAQSAVEDVVANLDAREVVILEVPRTCRDGFMGAMWAEPAAYLEPATRAAMSGLSLLDADVVDRAMRQLAADIADGTWERRNAELASRQSLDVGFRLVVAGQAAPRVAASLPMR